MDTIKKANKILAEGILLLPDDAKESFKTYTGIMKNEAINNACGMLNDNEEKIAMLKAYAVQEANSVVSILWREQLLTPELEAEYRELPSMKEMADAYNVFTDERKKRMDAVMDQHRAIANEEKELDIFKGVVNGMSKEESEKKYEEYQKQQQQAMGAR